MYLMHYGKDLPTLLKLIRLLLKMFFIAGPLQEKEILINRISIKFLRLTFRVITIIFSLGSPIFQLQDELQSVIFQEFTKPPSFFSFKLIYRSYLTILGLRAINVA